MPVASVFEVAAVVLIHLMVSNAENTLVHRLIPLLFAGTILLFTHQAGIVSHLLLARPFQTIGRFSYSIYMVHIFVYLSIAIAMRLVEKALGRSLQSAHPSDPSGPTRLD